MAAAVPIAAMAIQAYGENKAARAGKTASANAEHARREAVQYVQPSNIYKMSQWLFPGLLGTPPADTAAIPEPGKQQQFGPAVGGVKNLGQAGNNLLMNQLLSKNPEAFGLPPGKAQGGPVQAGQPYTVGEQGPEVVVPNQSGTVVPNPGPTPGSPGPLPAPTDPGSGLATENLGGQQAYQNPYDQFYANQSNNTLPNNPNQNSVQKWMSQSKQNMQTQKNLNTLQQGVNTDQNPANNPVASAYPQNPTLGQLSVNAATNFLQNPGQVSTIQYERAQEQANQGLNTNVQGLMGALTGMGISPRSGMAQTLLQGAVAQSNKARSEANRDLAIQEETLKRQDILAGMTAYNNFLNQVFGIVGTQAGTAGGGQFPQVPATNPYAGISQGLAAAGNLLANNKGSGGTGSPNLSEGGSTGF